MLRSGEETGASIVSKLVSKSAPSSPKSRRDVSKSSTLPPPRLAGTSAAQQLQSMAAADQRCQSGASGSGSVTASPRKSRSATLSNFFKKLSPKLRQSTSSSGPSTSTTTTTPAAATKGKDKSAVQETRVRRTEEFAVSAAAAESTKGGGGGGSAKGTPPIAVKAAGKGVSPKKLVLESLRSVASSSSSSSKTSSSSSQQRSTAVSKEQPEQPQTQQLHATFGTQPLIRINSGSASSPGESVQISTSRVGLRRIKQPPRTLNILNKIVVHPPDAQKIKGKMASVESIGSCSLDVDATASESSATLDGRASSVSQRTLHSASVDLCSAGSTTQTQVTSTTTEHRHHSHGHHHHHHHHHHRHHSSRSPTDTLVDQSAAHTTEERYVTELFIPTDGSGSGGGVHGTHRRPSAADGVTPSAVEAEDRKPPSYINISCSVSGYTSYSCYNSKVREGLRSRDASPARMAFTNGAGPYPAAGRTIDIELADDEGEVVKTSSSSSASSNGLLTTTTTHTSRVTLNVNGADEVDRASQSVLSPSLRNGSQNGDHHHPHHQTNGKSLSSELISASNLSPARKMYRDFSATETSSSLERRENGDLSVVEQKSLIQQRIERLYGPAALAQGFRLQRERRTSSSVESTVESSSRPAPHSNSAEVLSAVAPKPVFKHLHKDFCEQLKTSKSVDSCSASPSRGPPSPYRTFGTLNGTSASFDEAVIHAPSRSDIPNGTKFKPSVDKASISNGDASHQNGCSDPRLRHLSPETSNGHDKLPPPDASTKNGQWFIDIMLKEKDGIRKLITKAEHYLDDQGLSDDVSGRIRAAIGKANLLLSQKFEQFKGLCVKNMNQDASEQFPTTVEDLAGFWDMVLIQVGDIHRMFEKIEKLRLNNWIVDELENGTKDEHGSVSLTDGAAVINKLKKPSLKKTSRGGGASQQPQSAKSQEAARAREEARQRLLEAKRKGRQQSTQKVESPGIEIYVADDKE